MAMNSKMGSGEGLCGLFGIGLPHDEYLDLVDEDDESVAKIIKFSGYLVDLDGRYTYNDFRYVLETYLDDAMLRHLTFEEADIGEWNDDHPLNYINCDVEECEQYFVEHPRHV